MAGFSSFVPLSSHSVGEYLTAANWNQAVSNANVLGAIQTVGTTTNTTTNVGSPFFTVFGSYNLTTATYNANDGSIQVVLPNSGFPNNLIMAQAHVNAIAGSPGNLYGHMMQLDYQYSSRTTLQFRCTTGNTTIESNGVVYNFTLIAVGN